MLTRMWSVMAVERIQHTRAARVARIADRAKAEAAARDEALTAWPER